MKMNEINRFGKGDVKSMSQMLREIDVGDSQTFVGVKSSSLITTIQRLKFEGYLFKRKFDYIKGSCLVTKIKNP